MSERNGVSVAVVHNGIIENHEELRASLREMGYAFTSQTDTEVIAHLLHMHLSEGHTLPTAVRMTRSEITGQYAFAAITPLDPGQVCATRHGAPLLLGDAGAAGLFLASDICALIHETRTVTYLDDGDVVLMDHQKFAVWGADGQSRTPVFVQSELSSEAVSLNGYNHFMQKEMYEQPSAVKATLELASLAGCAGSLFGPTGPEALATSKQVLILACGTSYNAGVVAKYWIEAISRVPCTVEVASEYHYRNPALAPDTLVVVISQSGETADTKAALEYALHAGAKHSLAVCNVPESTLTRMVSMRFLTKAGPEVGVASTKAFTTQLVALYQLALSLALVKGALSQAQVAQKLETLHTLPLAMSEVLQHCNEPMRRWAALFARHQSAMFLGRDVLYPIAMEGSLKVKELSYIHAEAYAAGELKHGPLALIDEEMPVLVNVHKDALLEKVKSNIEEVLARKGDVFVIAGRGCHLEARDNLHIYELPCDVPAELAPLCHVVVHQMLSYLIALEKGTDVDKPRSLAKSVTTE